MSNFNLKISDLDREISLTESEVNSIVGGLGYGGRSWGAPYINNFQNQLTITSSQNNQGFKSKQNNVFVVYFK